MNNRTNNSVMNNRSSNSKTMLNRVRDFRDSDSTTVQVIKIALVGLIVLSILYLIKYFIMYQYNKKLQAPYIVRGTKNAKNSLVVAQDPSNVDSVTLYRSDNEEGAEFTYSLWILIDNLQYKQGEEKHVFHKGNKTGNPNKAPGVYILKNENTLRIYMNTFENSNEHVDIKNIPVRKWIHLAIVLNHKYLDIYFNGYLKKRHEFSSLPRQNYGDLWVNLFGGFDGYISRFRYYKYALNYKEVEAIVREGPSKDACGDTGEYPPYLDDAWWFDM